MFYYSHFAIDFFYCRLDRKQALTNYNKPGDYSDGALVRNRITQISESGYKKTSLICK